MADHAAAENAASDRATLEALGEIRRPSVSDLFVATMKGTYA